MTEQSFPTGGTAVAEPPAPADPIDFDNEAQDDSNRKKLMVIGAAAGVVVLLIAAFMLLKGGGSPTTQGFVAPQHPAAPVSTGTKATKAHKPVHLPKNFKGNVGKDPFHPLVTQAAAAAAPSDGSTGTAGTTGTTGTTGSTGTTTTTGSTGTTTTTTTTVPHKPIYRPVWIRLTHVGANGATFDIGYSNHHTLKVLEVRVKAPTTGTPRIFAKDFALLRLSGGTAVLQFGDGSPFQLDRTHNVMIVN